MSVKRKKKKDERKRQMWLKGRSSQGKINEDQCTICLKHEKQMISAMYKNISAHPHAYMYTHTHTHTHKHTHI